MLEALLHPDAWVTGFVRDEETLCLARSLSGRPDNLEFELEK